VHPSWEPVLAPHRALIDSLLSQIATQECFPERNQIFRALELPMEKVRVIILGQDPYPTPGMAEGLAFSIPENAEKIPPSLHNIFTEYVSDLNLPRPRTGHLGKWVDAGVLLLNRILTVTPGAPLSHQGLGWERVTDSLMEICAASSPSIPIICWGKAAQVAAEKNGFRQSAIFASPHPSPLSAYRGFFGSRPFSSVNDYLMKAGLDPIDWRL